MRADELLRLADVAVKTSKQLCDDMRMLCEEAQRKVQSSKQLIDGARELCEQTPRRVEMSSVQRDVRARN